MSDQLIGVLHPGEMGAAVAAVLRGAGHEVIYAADGRSAETTTRATAAGLTDVGTVAAVAERSDVLLSICPPHAALDVANAVTGAGFSGTFVDANAVSPATARAVSDVITGGGGRMVDGGIVGGPPTRPGTILCVSGPDATSVAALFAGTVLEIRELGDRIGAASAAKMCYAAWTKGTAALLLAINAVARGEAVDGALQDLWSMSQPELRARGQAAARSAVTKGWRWVGEMEEIAATFESVGLPGGFHEAAAEVFARSPRRDPGPDPAALLDEVAAGLATVPDAPDAPDAPNRS